MVRKVLLLLFMFIFVFNSFYHKSDLKMPLDTAHLNLKPFPNKKKSVNSSCFLYINWTRIMHSCLGNIEKQIKIKEFFIWVSMEVAF